MKKILALILAVLMLCSVALVAISAEDEPAEDAVNWEELYIKYGLNVYIGEATVTPPVLDGKINPGEYTYERETAYENLWEVSGTGEIQSGLKEYFAHDANYIYIGAQFEQKNDNRAYWIQWRPFNSFDIFRDDADLEKYYYSRTSIQLRWMAATETEAEFLKKASDWGWTRPEQTTAFPTDGYAGEGRDFEYAGSKVTDAANSVYTKTYEVKIAKSYIATISKCEVSEVRVLPYWTFFHANLQHAAPLSTDLVNEIVETDFTAFTPTDKNTYWFLVCDKAPSADYKPAVGNTYVAPEEDEGGADTDAPAVEGAETTAAETTAAETTAAATTAAATTAAETEAEKSGCGSSLAISALAVIPTLAGGALLLKRRKED